MSMTKDYILEHASRIASGDNGSEYENFGRKVADLILRSAANDNAVIASEVTDSVKLTMTADISENVPAACVTATVATPFGSATIHVG